MNADKIVNLASAVITLVLKRYVGDAADIAAVLRAARDVFRDCEKEAGDAETEAAVKAIRARVAREMEGYAPPSSSASASGKMAGYRPAGNRRRGAG